MINNQPNTFYQSVKSQSTYIGKTPRASITSPLLPSILRAARGDVCWNGSGIHIYLHSLRFYRKNGSSLNTFPLACSNVCTLAWGGCGEWKSISVDGQSSGETRSGAETGTTPAKEDTSSGSWDRMEEMLILLSFFFYLLIFSFTPRS